MSRSYRRPFAAVTGAASAKDDKRLAHRGARRKQNLALKTCLKTNIGCETLLLPHPLECTWNNTWVWGRDGTQLDRSHLRYSTDESTQNYYRKLLRK
jgi:hypothetical protein